jgi:hypothetical protein
MKSNKIRFHNAGAIALVVIVILIVFTCIAYADRNVPAMPEIQGLSTSTGMNVQGTITETDSGAWSVNANGIPLSVNDPILAQWPGWASQPYGYNTWHAGISQVPPYSYRTLEDYLTYWSMHPELDQGLSGIATGLLTWLENQGSPLTPPLQSGEVQYTTGYNDQLMAVSGQSVLSKTMAVSTASKIADQSSIKADTSLQYIAIDTGRATRTEDILLDGVAQATDTSDAILCPFASSVSPVIPAYCNIEQAGSSIDSTLTSVVTHADDRFVGTDSTFPVVLNYQINAQGITLSDGSSSPMIGSVSAYLKVHVQEARNQSLVFIPSTFGGGNPDMWYSQNPLRSEDLVYSETSSASGLVNKFSKSMSYQSGFNLI